MMQMSRRHVNMMTSAAASVVSSSCANIAFSLDAIIVASIIIAISLISLLSLISMLGLINLLSLISLIGLLALRSRSIPFKRSLL